MPSNLAVAVGMATGRAARVAGAWELGAATALAGDRTAWAGTVARGIRGRAAATLASGGLAGRRTKTLDSQYPCGPISPAVAAWRWPQRDAPVTAGLVPAPTATRPVGSAALAVARPDALAREGAPGIRAARTATAAIANSGSDIRARIGAGRRRPRRRWAAAFLYPGAGVLKDVVTAGGKTLSSARPPRRSARTGDEGRVGGRRPPRERGKAEEAYGTLSAVSKTVTRAPCLISVNNVNTSVVHPPRTRS